MITNFVMIPFYWKKQTSQTNQDMASATPWMCVQAVPARMLIVAVLAIQKGHLGHSGWSRPTQPQTVKKLACTVYSDIFLLEPTLAFRAAEAAVACLLGWTRLAKLCSSNTFCVCHSWSQLFLLWPMSEDTDCCRVGISHNNCSFLGLS